MYNKKVLSTAKKELNKAKAPKKPKDIITDPMGQWKYPGLPTRIPGNDITMEGVGYPVLGIGNNGQRKIMLPGGSYTFPGADYVDEYPQMKRGGTRKRRKTKSLSGTNELMLPHPLLRNYKNRVYDPNVDYFQDGGYIEAELTPEEIEEYRKGGYIVEDISVPELTKAQKGRHRDKKVIEISDPAEYAYRKKAYDDSLFLDSFGDDYKTRFAWINKYAKKGDPGHGEPVVGNIIDQSYIPEKFKKVWRESNIQPTIKYVLSNQNVVYPIFKEPLHKVVFKEKPKPETKSSEKLTNSKTTKQSNYPVGYQPYSLYGKVLDPEVYGYGESNENKPLQLAQGADMMLKKTQMEKYKKSGKYPWVKQEGGESAPVKELDEVTITPVSMYQQEYKDANSYDDFYNQKVDEYLRNMPKGLGKMMGINSDRIPSNLIKKINDEYQYNMNNYVTDQVLKNKKYDIDAREEWVDKLTPSEYEAFADSKYTGKLKPNLWTRTRAGVRALGNTLLPGQPISYDIKGLTPKEQKQYKEDNLAAFDALAAGDLPGAWVGNYLVDARDYAKRPDLLSGELNANLAEGAESLLNPLAYAEGPGLFSSVKAGIKTVKNARQARKLNKVLKNLKPKSSRVTNIGLDTYSGDSFTPIRIVDDNYKYAGQEWFKIDPEDYRHSPDWRKEGLDDASISLNESFNRLPNYGKETFDVGDFNFKQFSEGDNALKDLYAKLSKQKQLKADDFYTDQEVLELANKYKKHLENLENFDKSNPLDPTEMIWGALTGKGNARDELFNTLYPDSFQPSFREKFLTPAQEQLLKQYNFKTGSKGSLEKNSLKTFGDMFYKPQQNIESPLIRDLKNFDDQNAFFYSDPEIVVPEFRGMLNLSLDDIKKLSPDELIKYRDKVGKILKQQTIDRINNQLLRNKFTGKKAWDEITKYPGYYNKLGGLIEAKEGGIKTHKSKDGTITNTITKPNGDVVIQVKTKDGKYYEKVKKGLPQFMKDEFKKRAEWEDRSSGAAQPVDWVWTLPMGMASSGVKGAVALGKGLGSVASNVGKSSLVQAGKAALNQSLIKSLPGSSINNLVASGFAGNAINDVLTGKVAEPWKKANKSGKKSDYIDAVTENMFTALDAFPLYGAIGKGTKQLGKYAITKTPLKNVPDLFKKDIKYVNLQDQIDDIVKNSSFKTEDEAFNYLINHAKENNKSVDDLLNMYSRRGFGFSHSNPIAAAEMIKNDIHPYVSPYLYHGTSDARLKSILESGLDNSKGEAINTGGTMSDALGGGKTTAAGDMRYAKSFADFSANATKGKPVILRFKNKNKENLGFVGMHPSVKGKNIEYSFDGGKTWNKGVNNANSKSGIKSQTLQNEYWPKSLTEHPDMEYVLQKTPVKDFNVRPVIENLPTKKTHGYDVTKDEVYQIINQNLEYLTDPEYIKRRQLTTKESPEKIQKEINKYIENLKKSKIDFNTLGDFAGVYKPGKRKILNPFKKTTPHVGINPNEIKSRSHALHVLDHEIGHALSPISRGEFKGLSKYKNYPNLRIAKEHSEKGYLSSDHEQQVRLNRIKNYLYNKHGVSKNKPLSEEDFKLFTDDYNKWMSESHDGLGKGYIPIGMGDISDMLSGHIRTVGGGDKTRRNVRAAINKSWGLLPVGIGAGLLNNSQNQKLNQKKKGGIVADLTQKEIDEYIAKGYIVEDID